ncbi:MAG: hypothetical protein KDC53_19275 [Saprospiraceae bacterium]|nr:hypothetical protein [Saprospiraceae bacterium]
MISQVLKKTWMFSLLALAVLSACNKDDSLSSGDVTTDNIENYVDSVVNEMHERSGCGKFGCFEFVFPITIAFPDGTTTEVADYAALRDALHTYREENPDGERPTLSYPLDVMTQDGEVVTLASADELDQLRMQCADSLRMEGHRGGHRGGHGGHDMFCFSVNFPLSIALPDGTTVEVADRVALKDALRSWKEDNPDSTDRPELVFPITVTMEDGTVVTVESKDDLKDLKDSCSQ